MPHLLQVRDGQTAQDSQLFTYGRKREWGCDL